MGKRINFPEEQLEEMTMMYQYGFSAPEIAEWFDVDDNTVYRRLKERDVKIGTPVATYIERDIPNPWTNVDAAYVFDVLIGDAPIDSTRRIVLNTHDREFITTFSGGCRSGVWNSPEQASGEERRPCHSGGLFRGSRRILRQVQVEERILESTRPVPRRVGGS